MIIEKYDYKKHELELINMLLQEGKEWGCYTTKDVIEKYKQALTNSITYIAIEDNKVVGYSRSIDDNGFYIYICDLLVDKNYRNKGIGKYLVEQLCVDYPSYTTYVMSDADGFYIKKGYHREGSIFEVRKDN
jgi:GNAT superfamily N-acetyltransferase